MLSIFSWSAFFWRFNRFRIFRWALRILFKCFEASPTRECGRLEAIDLVKYFICNELLLLIWLELCVDKSDLLENNACEDCECAEEDSNDHDKGARVCDNQIILSHLLLYGIVSEEIDEYGLIEGHWERWELHYIWAIYSLQDQCNRTNYYECQN